jgi:hypothetical protein
MTWLGWTLAGLGVLWGGCVAVALPVFLVADTRNNRAHRNTGLLGYAHTLCRVPLVVVVAPLYLALVVGSLLRDRRDRG